MASSQQNKVVVHVKSTSRFEHDTDDGRGFKRGRNHEQSNPKDNFRGGLHRGRGTSSHRGHRGGHTRNAPINCFPHYPPLGLHRGKAGGFSLVLNGRRAPRVGNLTLEVVKSPHNPL